MTKISESLPITGISIDHIAVAVRSIGTAAGIYKALGGVPGGLETVEDQGVQVLPVNMGNTKIELLQPLHDKTPVGRFLEKRGEGLHHIALRVENVVVALEECRRHGIEALDASPRKGAEGRLIAFLNPKSTGGVLIELTQLPSPGDE
jgi:methylmalonyl-CoA/ethylmalonyl-CoA epimerase